LTEEGTEWRWPQLEIDVFRESARQATEAFRKVFITMKYIVIMMKIDNVLYVHIRVYDSGYRGVSQGVRPALFTKRRDGRRKEEYPESRERVVQLCIGDGLLGPED
jgi:hypothetical protein